MKSDKGSHSQSLTIFIPNLTSKMDCNIRLKSCYPDIIEKLVAYPYKFLINRGENYITVSSCLWLIGRNPQHHGTLSLLSSSKTEISVLDDDGNFYANFHSTVTSTASLATDKAPERQKAPHVKDWKVGERKAPVHKGEPCSSPCKRGLSILNKITSFAFLRKLSLS